MKREALKKEWAYKLAKALDQEESTYDFMKDKMTDELTQDECEEVFDMVNEK